MKWTLSSSPLTVLREVGCRTVPEDTLGREIEMDVLGDHGGQNSHRGQK